MYFDIREILFHIPEDLKIYQEKPKVKPVTILDKALMGGDLELVSFIYYKQINN